MNDNFRCAHTTADTPGQIASDLRKSLGDDVQNVVLFFAPRHDGATLARQLRQLWPGVKVVGCSTSGEISSQKMTNGGVAAAALGKSMVKRSAVALARFDQGIAAGVRAAVASLEAQLGQPLRALDPQKHVGIVFFDSTHGVEDDAHVELGNLAPLLSFVGGSAGDDIAFENTRVLAGEEQTNWGGALMVLEVTRPFQAVKLCHFKPTETHFTVTASEGRRLIGLEGRPAAEVYAQYLGVTVAQLGFDNLALNPAGLVIDGEAWVRQVVPPFHRDGAMLLGGHVPVGSQLYFLKPGDIIGHMRNQMQAVRKNLGGLEGMLVFDCALRRLEVERLGIKAQYEQAFDFPVAGFHTHGESWLGHMHQTLTAIAFG